MDAPPPVPVTQPSVQNLAQREGIKLAGWSGLLDWTRWSLLPAGCWPSAGGAILEFYDTIWRTEAAIRKIEQSDREVGAAAKK